MVRRRPLAMKKLKNIKKRPKKYIPKWEYWPEQNVYVDVNWVFKLRVKPLLE